MCTLLKSMVECNIHSMSKCYTDITFIAFDISRSLQRQHLKNLDNEIENYKKTILKEQENNENLTLHYNKACAEEGHVKKLMETSETKQGQLRSEYSMYSRVLQETSQGLAKENTVREYWTCL